MKGGIFAMERTEKSTDETVYQYDYSNRAWVEASMRYAALPVKDVPVIIFGEFSLGEWDYQCFHSYRRQRMVWCLEHERFEKVHHIERIDSIRSVDGCRERGMAAYFSLCAPPIERKLTVPYRWRIIRYEGGRVKVQADAIRFRLVYTGENEYKEPLAENYILRPCRITLGEVFDIEQGESAFCNPRRDWRDFGIDIPSAVTAKVFEFLQENAANGCNLFQESITDGVKKLRAFVKRPMDFHIEYWRDFFSVEEFSIVFQKNQQDNFSALCHALKLTPTKSSHRIL